MNGFDIVATLTEMTVISIKLSIETLPKTPLNIIISGGGQNNDYLIERIKKHLILMLKRRGNLDCQETLLKLN